MSADEETQASWNAVEEIDSPDTKSTVPEPRAQYIALFHGREAVDTVLEDWGVDGPIIGPVQISWTYGTVKVHPTDWDGQEFLPEINGLIEFNGMFYGDFEIVSGTDTDWLERARSGSEPRAFFTYDEFVKKITKPRL